MIILHDYTESQCAKIKKSVQISDNSESES